MPDQRKTKISVIMIFLNAEKFIKEAIESVLAQTYVQWELLLVDDGSNDGSTVIAKTYAQQFPDKIKYFEHAGHQNRGTGPSRDLGCKKAQGEYLAFLDSDDIYLPQKLEKQSEILVRNPNAAMVYGPTLNWYGWTGQKADLARDQVRQLGVPLNKFYEPPQLMTVYLAEGRYVPCICGLLVRKNALAKVGGFEAGFKGLFEDQVFCAKIALNYPIYVAEDCWDKYRKHSDSICAKANAIESRSDPQQTHNQKLIYLQWLSQYVSQQKFKDRKLNDALQKAFVPYQAWRS